MCIRKEWDCAEFCIDGCGYQEGSCSHHGSGYHRSCPPQDWSSCLGMSCCTPRTPCCTDISCLWRQTRQCCQSRILQNMKQSTAWLLRRLHPYSKNRYSSTVRACHLHAHTAWRTLRLFCREQSQCYSLSCMYQPCRLRWRIAHSQGLGSCWMDHWRRSGHRNPVKRKNECRPAWACWPAQSYFKMITNSLLEDNSFQIHRGIVEYHLIIPSVWTWISLYSNHFKYSAYSVQTTFT